MSTTSKTGKKTASNGATYRAAGLAAQIAAERVLDLQSQLQPHFAEKCARRMLMYILRAVQDRQDKGARGNPLFTPSFPESEYVLLAEKLAGPSATKRTVKTVADNSPPKKTRLRRKGQTGNDGEEEAHEESDEEEAPEAAPEEEEIKAPEAAPKKKRNVAMIQKQAKSWLQFIVNRWVYEVFSMELDNDDLGDLDAFLNQILANGSGDFDTSIGLLIAYAVRTKRDAVRDYDSYHFDEDMRQMFNAEEKACGGKVLSDRVSKYVVEVIMTYFKLLGNTLALNLTYKRGAINGNSMAHAMEILDCGSEEYMREHGHQDAGITTGILEQALEFCLALEPPKTPSTKAAPKKKEKTKVKKEPAAAAATTDDDADEDEDEAPVTTNGANHASDDEDEDEDEDEAPVVAYEDEDNDDDDEDEDELPTRKVVPVKKSLRALAGKKPKKDKKPKKGKKAAE